MVNEWAIVESETVQSKRKISLPDSVLEHVMFINNKEQPSVYWNYDSTSDLFLISNKELKQCSDTQAQKIYDESSGLKIRPPKKGLPDITLIKIRPGVEIFYLAHEDMLSGDVKSVYLLTTDQVKQALPSNENTSDDLKSKILETPGFL